MKKYSVLQTTTYLEQIRWIIEASSPEEAINKVKSGDVEDDNIDEEQTFTKDISYEAEDAD